VPAVGFGLSPRSHATDMRHFVKEHFDLKDLSREAKRKIIYDKAKRFYAL
jgi:hypothetical protein